jgi:hypothetical protein
MIAEASVPTASRSTPLSEVVTVFVMGGVLSGKGSELLSL